MQVLPTLIRAVIAPARPRPDRLSWRRLLLLPVAFDVVSAALQLRDLSRLGQIKTNYGSDNEYFRRVQDYNSGVTIEKKITTTRRAEPLYRAVDFLVADPKPLRLLIIGPRNIQELFLAWAYGYRWRNITGIDLYSTNPSIKVMNMEEMSFADGSFDVVTMANTLAYAKDAQRCLAGVARVLAPRGLVSFHATYCPGADDWAGNKLSGNAIRGMLRDVGLQLRLHNADDKVNRLGLSQTGHLFVAEKPSNTPQFDPVDW